MTDKYVDEYHKIINGHLVAINLPDPKPLTEKQKEDNKKSDELLKVLNNL